MAGQGDGAGPVIVMVPPETDMLNADAARDLLCASCVVGAAVVVADMTSTTFCDSSGFREILAGRRRLAEVGVELRLAVPPGNVRRVIKLLGLDRAMPVFPTVAAAIAGHLPTGR